MKMKIFRKWAYEMLLKYDVNVTFEELHRRGEIWNKKKYHT